MQGLQWILSSKTIHNKLTLLPDKKGQQSVKKKKRDYKIRQMIKKAINKSRDQLMLQPFLFFLIDAPQSLTLQYST